MSALPSWIFFSGSTSVPKFTSLHLPLYIFPVELQPPISQFGPEHRLNSISISNKACHLDRHSSAPGPVCLPPPSDTVPSPSDTVPTGLTPTVSADPTQPPTRPDTGDARCHLSYPRPAIAASARPRNNHANATITGKPGIASRSRWGIFHHRPHMAGGTAGIREQ